MLLSFSNLILSRLNKAFTTYSIVTITFYNLFVENLKTAAWLHTSMKTKDKSHNCNYNKKK